MYYVEQEVIWLLALLLVVLEQVKIGCKEVNKTVTTEIQ